MPRNKITRLTLRCGLASTLIIFCLILTRIGSDAAETPASESGNLPKGFTTLFNGTDLGGWWGADTEDPREYMALPPVELQKKRAASLENIQQHWSVQGGELVNDGKGLFLTTEKFYADFELLVDYKTVPLADSGIYLRGCPQVQIWDSTEKAKFALGADKGSGGLWNNSPGLSGKDPLVKADKPFGQWNQLRVKMVGSRVWVWLNGQQTVNGAILENYYNRKLPVPPKGPIQLQTHGGEIRWRNVFIREIASDEANKVLRQVDPGDFKPVFNGLDLTGWEVPDNCCHITNGTILWQSRNAGMIYTKEEFTNFVVRLEFKLPPGGNNGLAIRYPGTGPATYEGMCECQVLDDNYEKATGQKIDPRQAHGSAYGMVAALRGYQHPIGEWNYEEVTVIGHTIRVELNGTTILDADLSTVTECMDGSKHPGKDRTWGHFGLLGHSDPVAFRDIAIKSLN